MPSSNPRVPFAVERGHRRRGKACQLDQVIIKEFGLTEDDVFGGDKKTRKASNAKGGTVAPKYKDPESGKRWKGRGKAPLWIAGKDKEQFAI